VGIDFEERAQAVLANVEGLDDAEISSVYEEWRQLGSENLDALVLMALDLLSSKRGLPSSRERARARLRRQGTIE
jgi:hypothetical protein